MIYVAVISISFAILGFAILLNCFCISSPLGSVQEEYSHGFLIAYDEVSGVSGMAIVVTRLRKVVAAVVAEADVLGIDCVGATLAVPGARRRRTRETLYVAPNLHWFDADLAEVTTRCRVARGRRRCRPERGQPRRAGRAALRGRSRAVLVRLLSGGVGIGAGIVMTATSPEAPTASVASSVTSSSTPTGAPAPTGPGAAWRRSPGGPATLSGRGAAALALRCATSCTSSTRRASVPAGPSPNWVRRFAGRGRGTAGRHDARRPLASLHGGGRHLGVDAALIGAATVALAPVLSDPTVATDAASSDHKNTHQ